MFLHTYQLEVNCCIRILYEGTALQRLNFTQTLERNSVECRFIFFRYVCFIMILNFLKRDEKTVTQHNNDRYKVHLVNKLSI